MNKAAGNNQRNVTNLGLDDFENAASSSHRAFLPRLENPPKGIISLRMLQ